MDVDGRVASASTAGASTASDSDHRNSRARQRQMSRTRLMHLVGPMMRRQDAEGFRETLTGWIAEDGGSTALLRARDLDGCTPLHLAVHGVPRYAPLVLQELLRAGADPSLQSHSGDTALHFLARRLIQNAPYLRSSAEAKHRELEKALDVVLAAGGPLTTVNGAGETPISILCEHTADASEPHPLTLLPVHQKCQNCQAKVRAAQDALKAQLLLCLRGEGGVDEDGAERPPLPVIACRAIFAELGL